MKTTRILFIALILSSSALYGQQEYQFMNAVNNPYILNPAAGGISNVLHLELSSRLQWMGYNGPQSFLLTGNSVLKTKKTDGHARDEFNLEDKAFFSNPAAGTGTLKHIIGGRALSETIGPFSKTAVYGSYAIHLPFTKKINFGAGLGMGWSSFRIVQDRVVLFQEDDATYSQFLGNTSGQNIFDVNAGLVFYNDHLFVGLSTTQIMRNKAKFAQIATESFYNRHFFLTAKYRFDFENKLGLEPSIVLKMAEKSPTSLDVGLRFSYNRSAWLGLQYRSSNALTFQVGANIIKNLYLSYGYELGMGKLHTMSNATHEIQLGIYLGANRNINKELKEKKEKHPGH